MVAKCSIKVVAALLVVAQAAYAVDGGTDVPYANLDAGLAQVTSARQPDGGTLGPGWWMSGDRLQRIAKSTVVLKNENVELQFENKRLHDDPGTWRWWLVGIALGFAGGCATTFYVVKQLQK